MTEPSSPAAPARSADDDIRDLAGGALVAYLGKLARITRGAFIWVITLLCGAEVQGLYSLGWGIVSIVNKVARFGVLRSVVYFVNAARTDHPGDPGAVDRALGAAFSLVLVASGAVTLLVVLTADSVAAFYGKPVAGALRIMAWATPFVALCWVLISATRALRIMRYEVYVLSVAGPLVLFAGGLGVGLAGLGLEAVSWVQLAMSVSEMALGLYFFRRHFSLAAALRAVRRGTPWRKMAAFSVPVMAADMIFATLTQLDVLMLSWFVSAGQVGLFVLARRVASIMLRAPQAFDPIFSSVVSELSLQSRHRELGHRFVVISRWILTVNLPLFAGLLIVGDTLLPVLAGDDLQGLPGVRTGLTILMLLSVTTMVQAAFAMAEPLLSMSGRPTLNLVNNLLWLGSNAGLSVWLIGRYGIVGAAWAALGAVLLVNAVRLGQVYFLERILPIGRAQLKPLAAAVAAAIPALLAYQAVSGVALRLIAPTALFLPVYGACLLLLGFEPEDRMLLGRLRRRLGRTQRPEGEV